MVAVPQTYMNESGRAVAPLVRRAGIDQPDRRIRRGRLTVEGDRQPDRSGRRVVGPPASAGIGRG